MVRFTIAEKPRGERESLVIQLLAQISGERGDLIVDQAEGHPGEMGRVGLWKRFKGLPDVAVLSVVL